MHKINDIYKKKNSQNSIIITKKFKTSYLLKIYFT